MYSTVLLSAALFIQVVLSQPSDSSQQPVRWIKSLPRITYWGSEGDKTVRANPEADYLVISKEIPNTSEKRIIVHVLYRSLGNSLFTEIDRYVSRFLRDTPDTLWINRLGLYIRKSKGLPRYPELVSDLIEFTSVPPNATVIAAPYVSPSQFEQETWMQKLGRVVSLNFKQPEPLSMEEIGKIQDVVQQQLRLRWEEHKQKREIIFSMKKKYELLQQISQYSNDFDRNLQDKKVVLFKMKHKSALVEKLEKKLKDGQGNRKDRVLLTRALKELRDLLLQDNSYLSRGSNLLKLMEDMKSQYPEELGSVDIYRQSKQISPNYDWLDSSLDADVQSKAITLYHRLRFFREPKLVGAEDRRLRFFREPKLVGAEDMKEISKSLELPESTEEQSLSLEYQKKREEQASNSPQIDKAGSNEDVDYTDEDVDYTDEDVDYTKREEQASNSPQIDKAGSNEDVDYTDEDVDYTNEDDERRRLLETASSSDNSDFSPKRVLSVGQSMAFKSGALYYHFILLAVFTGVLI